MRLFNIFSFCRKAQGQKKSNQFILQTTSDHHSKLFFLGITFQVDVEIQVFRYDVDFTAKT